MPNRMEQLASKGMGKAKAAKAQLSGLSGVFRTLAQQHGEVTALLLRTKMSSDPEKRAELWQKIRAELLSHERAEVDVVYPVLRETPGTHALADHHDAEAIHLEQLIASIDAIDDEDSDEWSELFAELADTVQHHAHEEETEIFPKAEQVLGKETAEALESDFLEAKARVMDAIV